MPGAFRASGSGICAVSASDSPAGPYEPTQRCNTCKIQGPLVFEAILVVAALIFVNAVYVAAEFAAVSARRSRIRQLAEEDNRLACWLMPILERPVLLERYIAACQIGITVSGLVLGAYAQATIAEALTPWVAWAGIQENTARTRSIVIVLLLLTVAQVIFAELVPRSLTLRYPTPAALYAVVPMAPSMWLYRPFITWLNATGLVLRRLVGAPPRAHRHIHSPEAIELLFAESRDDGLIEPDEHRRLSHALRDRKSTRLNSSHLGISYAVFCLKKKKTVRLCRHHATYHRGNSFKIIGGYAYGSTSGC